MLSPIEFLTALTICLCRVYCTWQLQLELNFWIAAAETEFGVVCEYDARFAHEMTICWVHSWLFYKEDFCRSGLLHAYYVCLVFVVRVWFYICACWSFFQLKLPLLFCCFSYNEKKERLLEKVKASKLFLFTFDIMCFEKKRYRVRSPPDNTLKAAVIYKWVEVVLFCEKRPLNTGQHKHRSDLRP